MFDIVQNNKTVQLGMKILLGAISLSFIGFAGSEYSSIGNDVNEVVKVGDTPILQQQVERELQMRNLGPDKAEEVIQNLIQRQLLLEQARAVGLSVSDDDLRSAIASISAFQKDGHFSPELYQNYLKENRISTEMFETLRRNDLLVQQMAGQLMSDGFVSRTVSDRLGQFLTRQREISQVRIESATYLDQVKISDQEVAAYYKTNSKEFAVPEQVKLEYVLLSAKNLATSQVVTDDEIKNYFETNKAKFEREERQARHILLNVPADADAAAKNVIKAQAEKILDEVRKNPSQFADIAKASSQDTGSAQQGGDLGWVAADALDKDFSKALFSMKPNEVSGLVQSQFGYHIIQLTAVKKVGLEESKAFILEKLKEQKSKKLFPELAEQLSDLVVDNEKNLAPVATTLKLPLLTTDWFGKDGLVGNEIFSKKEILEKVFMADTLSGRASDLIELPDQQRIVLRVAERKPAHTRALQEVSGAIKAKLQLQGAAKLAAIEGQKQLQSLQKDPSLALSWSPAQAVSMQQGGAYTKEALKQVFALPEKDSAQFVGLAEQNGFTLLKVGKLIVPPLDPRLGQQLEQLQLMGEGDAYMKALQSEIKVLRKPVAAKVDG